MSACGAAVDDALRAHPPHGGMSTIPQTWLACCVTAVVVTHSMCWARLARASLGPYALAALAWMLRHSQLPWDALRVASVRVMLRPHGITAGHRIIDDTDNARSQSAKALAPLSKLRDKESGGDLWGPSLGCLVLVPPPMSIPGGCVFYEPAPARRAWYKQAKRLKQQGVPPTQRPPTPTPHAPSPTQQHLALRLLAAVKAHHPAIRVHGIAAEALYGPGACVEAASARFEGGQVLAPIRRTQPMRVGQRAQPVADYFATPPGTPHTLRSRGGAERVALVGSARLDVCAHQTQRCIVAIK